MSRSIKVAPFTLTDDDVASEHVYAGRLNEELANHDVSLIDDHRAADVVHLFEVNAYTRAALSAFQYPTLARLLYSDTPVVVSTDDLYFTGDPSLTVHPRLYRLNHYTQRVLFGRCDAVIAISESVRERLEPYLDPTKLHVVHHGVDEAYRVDEIQTHTDPFVLHVSLAAPRKNPGAVREVARRLETRFVIAGTGWEEYIPDTPAYENVELAGYVSESDLVDLYKRAAVFYFPTRHEGFGLPILEAMAAGCAVVTTNVYSVPEVVGDTARLFAPDDTGAHVAAIEDLVSDAESRRQLAERARIRSLDFTWDRSARKTAAIYRAVV